MHFDLTQLLGSFREVLCKVATDFQSLMNSPLKVRGSYQEGRVPSVL